jgi:hypothetical protein
VLRIGNVDDAKSMVRKYIVGTRSRHRKIASVTIGEDTKGPDDKGAWTIKGTYVTEDGDKEDFVASVTRKGEVLMNTVAPQAADLPPKPPGDERLRQSRIRKPNF